MSSLDKRKLKIDQKNSYSICLKEKASAELKREELARIIFDGLYEFVGLLDAQGMCLR